MSTVRIKHCPNCPWFSRGMNDPTCGQDIKVHPNSGAYGKMPPPKDCPMRKAPVVRKYYVANKER